MWSGHWFYIGPSIARLEVFIEIIVAAIIVITAMVMDFPAVHTVMCWPMSTETVANVFNVTTRFAAMHWPSGPFMFVEEFFDAWLNLEQ